MRNIDVHYKFSNGVCIASFCTEKAAMTFARECGSTLISVRVGASYLATGPLV